LTGSVTAAGLASCAAQVVPPGTVIMSSRAPIGHLAVAEVACCTNQGCKSFVPTESVDTWYLYFALKTAVPELKALGSGATFTEVSKTAVELFEIPVPPLSEQQRIAAILNEQMAVVERARAAAEARLEAAKVLPAAYLRAVFNSPEAQRWPRRQLREISLDKLIGLVRSNQQQNVSGLYRYLKMDNISTEGRLNLNSVSRIDATDDEATRYRLRKGDFLFNTRNSFELVGKTAVFDLDEEEWLFNNNIMRIRFTENIIPYFVLWAFHSDEVKQQLEAFKSNTTSVCAIYDRQLSAVRIPLPELSEQRRVTAMLNDKMAMAEGTRKVLEEQLDTINKLPAALLRRAFSGEL